MGIFISKPNTPKDKLFKFEEDILETEAHLSNLKDKHSSTVFIIFSFLTIPVVSFICYLEECYPVFVMILLILLFLALKMLLNFIHDKRIELTEKKLKDLKLKQKAYIKDYKANSTFKLTKGLIDKYDEEESRETFFSQIQKKKRGSVEKLTDLILGNDPEKMNALICRKCGIHNGLVDQNSQNIKFFYCYNCKEKNERFQEE